MKVRAPAPGFTGTVCGVRFVDGIGDTSAPGALDYFRRNGYQVPAAVTGIEVPVDAVGVLTVNEDGTSHGEVLPSGSVEFVDGPLDPIDLPITAEQAEALAEPLKPKRRTRKAAAKPEGDQG